MPAEIPGEEGGACLGSGGIGNSDSLRYSVNGNDSVRLPSATLSTKAGELGEGQVSKSDWQGLDGCWARAVWWPPANKGAPASGLATGRGPGSRLGTPHCTTDCFQLCASA